MNDRRLLSLVLVGAAAIAWSASAHADRRSSEIVTDVSFDFYAGETSLPAGSYKVLVVREGDGLNLQIRNEQGILVATVVPVTRLARQHMGDAPTGSLVFDASGGRSSLAEAWFPGQDGFLLRAATESHEHAVVEVKK